MLYLRAFGGLSLENGGRPLIGVVGQRGRLAMLAVRAPWVCRHATISSASSRSPLCVRRAAVTVQRGHAGDLAEEAPTVPAYRQ